MKIAKLETIDFDIHWYDLTNEKQRQINNLIKDVKYDADLEEKFATAGTSYLPIGSGEVQVAIMSDEYDEEYDIPDEYYEETR